MIFRPKSLRFAAALCAAFFMLVAWGVPGTYAACPPGTIPAVPGIDPADTDQCVIDPESIPKYVTPLVIPPVMKNDGEKDSYDIAVREFKQQILPGGIWDTVADPDDVYQNFPATTVWSYGPDADDLPDSTALGGGAGIAPAANSQFNFPAYTIETKSYKPVDVRWINDLKENFGAGPNFLPHLLPVDQTLHWANPLMDCIMGDPRTDCSGQDPTPYTGPVPIVTHVHGAHVDPHSDGYPEAWWLPAANNIDCLETNMDDTPDPGDDYACGGSIFDDANGQQPGNSGYADYSYSQDQPATTLWYHDHTLGMTRLNVYAGPAGFWLIRGGKYDKVDNVWTRKHKWDGRLPAPAPVEGDTVLELNVPGDPVRNEIREIPIVVQDRSFKPDGDLFYPDNRAFFEGIEPDDLLIDFVPDSDVAPIWNPEAFFNTMVVNGVSWPKLEVAPAIYRFRLLNGCNSRFLNLSLKIVESRWSWLVGKEISFYQIGAEQGFLPKVVEIRTGFATKLKGDGRRPKPWNRVPAPNPEQALLMTLAERADVLVDFRFLPNGTKIQMINTAPDAPFGGFPDDPADPETTGQVMQFEVNKKLFKFKDLFTTPPWALRLKAEKNLGPAVVSRNISLNEGPSEEVCVLADAATEEFLVPIEQVDCHNTVPGPGEIVVEFAPKEALLGTVNNPGTMAATGNGLKWTDANDPNNVEAEVTLENGKTVIVNVTENPTVGDTEEWNIYNFTEDAHPIHLHLVRFEVIRRTFFDGTVSTDNGLPPNGVQPWETGFKDTVIAYPGEVTTVKAKFDVEGLYVWHCHIVEHEDNEMMRPYVVSAK